MSACGGYDLKANHNEVEVEKNWTKVFISMSACGGYDLKANHNVLAFFKFETLGVYQYVRLRRIRFERKSQH
jgi:hypothetical protein